MTNQGSWISVRRARLRPVAMLVLAVLALDSCTSWVPATLPSPTATNANPATVLRITRSNNGLQEIRRANVVGDSVIGTEAGGSTRLAIPLADIRSVEIARFNGTRTVLLAAAIGVTILVIATAGSGPSSPPPPRAPVDSSFSCPLVYTWDGTGWRLDSGTFGGAIMRALQRTDVDNLDYATPADGTLRLKVANELNETDYVDALRVVAIDHDPALSVAPDAGGKIHTFGPLSAPVRATDLKGRDARARVTSVDGWNWESIPTGRDSSRLADVRDGLELTFVRSANARHAHLVLDGNNTPWAAYLLGEFVSAHGTGTQAWYDSLNAQPAAAAAMGTQIAREAFLNAAVWTGDRWTHQGMYWEAGPEVSKRQALDLDLSGVRGDTVLVRLESVPSFWLIDRVGIDYTTDRPVNVAELQLAEARDLRGKDVRALINDVDNTYYALEPGDAAELHYTVPAVPEGVSRTYLLRSTGWYHVNTPLTADRDAQLLWHVSHDPFGLSRVAVGRLNDALQRMGRAVQ